MVKPGIGIAYCVNDSRPYRRMLDTSIQSFKRFNESWPIEVVKLSAGTDLFGTIRWHLGSRAEAMTRRWIGDRSGREARKNAIAEKIRLFSDPPFEKTLFVDCDTIILRPLAGLFETIRTDVDVVVQQWMPGEFYSPAPPFTTQRFRRFNSGFVYFTRAFSERCRDCVRGCEVDIVNLHDQDQYVFSRVLELIEPARVFEHTTLQLTNRPSELNSLGFGGQATALKKIVVDRSDYFFYHYVYKKKASLANIRQWIDA